jgi:hypothetical protein
VALILATIAFIALLRAAKNLFGHKASFWTAATFAISGPFLALARLGVYDTLALAGIAVSFWAVTELERSDNRIWLGLAAIASTIGLFAKYPTGLMLASTCATILVLRRETAIMDLGIFGFMSLAIMLAFFLPVREQLVSLANWYITNSPTFGITPVMTAFRILYLSGAPFLLALSGWFVARDRRGLASVLLLSLMIWPAYHLMSGNPVSLSKHLVLGHLFAYPLVGLTLSALWGDAKRSHTARPAAAIVILLALAAIGVVQLDQFNRAWPDAREAADYLIREVQPGHKLLINESWPYTMYLYGEGRIESPWDVFDVYRIVHGQSEMDLCEFDWFVNSEGSYEWPESVLQTIEQCDTFQPVFSTTSTVVGLGSGLNYISYPVEIAVWQNTSNR